MRKLAPLLVVLGLCAWGSTSIAKGVAVDGKRMGTRAVFDTPGRTL